MPFCDKIKQTIQIIIKKPNYLNGSHKDSCLAFFSYTSVGLFLFHILIFSISVLINGLLY